MAVVNELVTKFSFAGSLQPLARFETGLGNAIKKITKMTAVITASATAFSYWANSVLRGAESLVRLSEDTGINIETLQRLQYIASQSGVSFGEFQSSLNNLTRKIGEAAIQGSEDFNRLGISVRDANGNIKDTLTILKEIAQKTKNLSIAEQQSFAEKLGIDNNLLQSLQQSDKDLEKLGNRAKSFGLITEKQKQLLNKYYQSIETIKFAYEAISRQVAISFAPKLIKLSNIFTDFINQFGGKFSNIISTFGDALGRIIDLINQLVQKTIGWKGVLIGLGVIFAIFNPVKTLIAGILLVVDDLITAFKGGKSVIADFFDGIIGRKGATKEFLHFLVNAFNKFINLLKKAIPLAGKGLKIAFETIKNIISNIWNIQKSIFNTIQNIYSFIVDKLISGFKKLKEIIINIVETIKILFNAIEDKINIIIKPISDITNKFKGIFGDIKGKFEAGINFIKNPFNSINQNSNVNININQQIHGADGKKIGGDTINIIKDELNNAEFYFGKGGR